MDDTAARYARFLQLVHEVHDLGSAMGLLEWDQEIMMPPRGVQGRARVRATVAALMHDRMVDPELGELVATLAGTAAADPGAFDPWARANLRELKRQRDRAVKVPRQLVADLAREGSLAQQAWVEARAKDDWARFAPHLARLVDLKRREAQAVGYATEPYDALLDEYEPGARAADLAQLFAQLRDGLVPILDALREAPHPPADAAWRGAFTAADQDRLGRAVLDAMGYDFAAGRLDVSAHPFTQGLGPGDVRITTRYDAADLRPALYATMHEGGHALYELGLPGEHAGEPVGSAVSLGIHESQSRLWENLVGRSRPFVAWLAPQLAGIWPAAYGGADPEALYRAANTVRPSLIRIEADEVTYNLHIILRLEIERALVAGEVEVDGLPSLWREKVKAYLGLDVPSDREGVLQDIHWSFGLFGYFPTYALGNLYASQLFAAARRHLPDLDAQLARGELAGLLGWLRANVHGPGSLYPAGELCVRVTGQELSPEPFLAHVRAKFGDVYGVSL
ncbi:MAG: carboxypeptidase M32 [Candidatus Krumholzibacteriia bacterium]